MLIRQMIREFDPVYIKPNTVAGAVKYLLAPSLTQHRGQARSPFERRLIDRRQRRVTVLLDLRSPHARRHINGRRNFDSSQITEGQCGIDVYA